MTNQREDVPFDPRFFEKREGSLEDGPIEETFRYIYRTNHWAGSDSVSGEGAGSTQTQRLAAELPGLLARLQVDVLLDVPCGDFTWMQHVDLPVSQYIGADIVPELVARNRRLYGSTSRRFLHLDLRTGELPPADLLLCRDGLVHLSFADIFAALRNIRNRPITYLLATTFPRCTWNEDITTGDWRVLNLQRPPFELPPPVELLKEGCTEADGQFADKSLGLWRVDDIRVQVGRG